MAREEKIMMTMMMAVMMLAVVQVLIPQPVQASYCCPICANTCFMTYDELYNHFTTSHPADPIEIIWE